MSPERFVKGESERTLVRPGHMGDTTYLRRNIKGAPFYIASQAAHQKLLALNSTTPPPSIMFFNSTPHAWRLPLNSIEIAH